MSENLGLYVRVAVHAPLKEPLTYLCESDIPRGTSVTVPLGKGGRASQGVVLGPGTLPMDLDPKKLKFVRDIHVERPRLSEAYLSWAEKVSQYYVFPLGMILELAFPPLKKTGTKKSTNILPSFHETLARPKSLTPDQTKCIADIESKEGFQTHLLFGVTGSGKTEVYLQLLERFLENGKRGLVLVPEISLTPQLISRFVGRFGDRVAVIHSHLTPRDRTNQWWEMIEGKKDILIGARSALFCPVDNLGIIIVDEEHEPSYKQDEKLKYNARDACVMMGQTLNIPVVLGSATPSLESWQNAISGKYHLHRMSSRASQIEMPEVEIIDLRSKDDDEDAKPKSFWATPQLVEQIAARLEKGEQSALFLNRRGLAQSVICPACGNRKECPNCSIGLTLHAKSHLVCHYCDYHETLAEVCDVCLDSELKPLGLGTELVEKDVEKLFPNARTVRADRDEIQNREELEEFIGKVERREADILIGTQMIAKGLDFPHLTLVGVLLADISLNLPDFRSAERSFQLLSQVSGRAGRHKTKGQVFIQTFNPEHPSILSAKTHDFEGFARQELQNRQELGYPPFGRLMLIRLQGLDQRKVEAATDRIAQIMTSWVARSKSSEGIEILGPTEAAIFRLRNNYRYQILVKAPKSISLSQMGWALLDQEAALPAGVRMLIDIDPINML